MNMLIDTNLLVHAWDSSNPSKQLMAIETITKYRSTAYISVQSTSEFSNVMLRNGCEPQWVKYVISMYGKIMTVLPIEGKDVERALQAVDQYQLSFWDAQIWAVAASNNINIILSEHGPTGHNVGGILYRNPFQEG